MLHNTGLREDFDWWSDGYKTYCLKPVSNIHCPGIQRRLDQWTINTPSLRAHAIWFDNCKKGVVIRNIDRYVLFCSKIKCQSYEYEHFTVDTRWSCFQPQYRILCRLTVNLENEGDFSHWFLVHFVNNQQECAVLRRERPWGETKYQQFVMGTPRGCDWNMSTLLLKCYFSYKLCCVHHSSSVHHC